MRGDEGFVGSPATRGELLLGGEQSEGVLHGLLVLGISKNDVGTRRRAQRDDVGVGVLTGEWISSVCQRVKEVAIKQVAFGQVAEGEVAGELSRSEEIFRHDKRFVVGRIFLPDTIVNLRRQQRLGTSEHAT